MPYRIATLILIAALFLSLLIPAGERIANEPPPPANGAVTFDPCDMWVCYGWNHNLAMLAFLVGFFGILTAGIRNRKARIWFPLLMFIGWGMVANYRSWEITRCGTVIEQRLAIVQSAALALLGLRHVVGPRPI